MQAKSDKDKAGERESERKASVPESGGKFPRERVKRAQRENEREQCGNAKSNQKTHGANEQNF